MFFYPSQAFVIPSARVQAKVYDAVEALRTAEAKLNDALDGFVERDRRIREWDLIAARATAWLFASIFQEVIWTGKPTLPDSVFRAIRDHKNYMAENVPHIEAATLALYLAIDCLDEAMELSAELDGPDIDEAYDVLVAAHGAVLYVASVLDGSMVSFWREEILTALCAGKAKPTFAELHQALVRELWKCHPDGRLPTGEIGWWAKEQVETPANKEHAAA